MKPAPPGKERESPRAARPDPDGRPAARPLGARTPRWTAAQIKAEEFQILTPRDLGDRESDPEQAPGSRMRRKG